MNKHYVSVTAAFFAAILLFGLTVPSTGLAKSTCAGGTITGGTVNGGLTITGGTCTVTGATIHGGINQSGGSLTVCGSEVDGGVNASGGSVTILRENEGRPGNCAPDEINGHVSISGVTVVELDHDTVNGGADIDGNGAGGIVELEGNDIQGSLNCAGNAPGTVTNDGFPNDVTGAETGQCAAPF